MLIQINDSKHNHLMKKKILILSNNCGGLVSFRREVFEALIKEGHTLLVVAPEDYKTDILKKIDCQYRPIKFNRQGTNPIADIKLMLAYSHIIKHEQPDIVLTYTIKPNLYGGMACRLTHTPQVANVTGLGIAVEKAGLLRTITKILYKLGLKKAQKVFFQNKKNMDFCEKNKMVSCPTALIPGSGVNLERFYVQPYPDESSCRFIYIGRVQRRKGIEQYLGGKPEQFPTTVQKYGNTSSASMAILLDELVRENRIERDDLLVMSGFGAGFTTGSCMLKY